MRDYESELAAYEQELMGPQTLRGKCGSVFITAMRLMFEGTPGPSINPYRSADDPMPSIEQLERFGTYVLTASTAACALGVTVAIEWATGVNVPIEILRTA